METWQPDFSSSEQPDPTWTRVSLPEGQVTNALNGIDWDEDPAQVVLCEACGYAGCASGGYVRVSRLHEWLLWTSASGGPRDMAEEPNHPIVRAHGGLAVSEPEWSRWRGAVPGLPGQSSFPSTTGQILSDAWRMSAVGPGRAVSLAEVVPTLRRSLLHADTLAVNEAIEAVSRLVEWLEDSANKEVSGRLVEPGALGVRIETLYFDAPEVTAWPALALGGDVPLLVLAPDLVFVPEA